MIVRISFIQICFLTIVCLGLQAQSNNSEVADAAKGLKLRGIGPALMGGRIADIAIHPADASTWYVAVGSGNLWKTTNRGATWTPVFDDQSVYSIGTVSIDPNHPQTIWVGTGENVSGRHVGWGDGVYKSQDGGKTWNNMGLKTSEHIGKILIDPRNSDHVLVAAEGPLWSSGGDRGLFQTKDGGKTWQQVLEIDQNTGVTDIEWHPENPNIIYAAAYQRRRHVWSLLGGGPNSGIYRSMDAGETWQKMTTGLPKGDVGKIGLAVTPANPSLVYATVEASDKEKGFYRSVDQGASWAKMSNYISGGTGPHYYQEIEASPTDPDLIYQMDVFIHVTRDGGKTFDYLGTGREKHSDNHALWIDPNDGNHLIAGTDAGLYESYDEGAHWRHFPNMPVSQFYKLGLDNAEPFYNIVGGAQDLGTLIGPSRTMNIEGVRNKDWYVPLGADGYDCMFDPSDPDIVYMEIQQGLLYRYDRKIEEAMNIQPKAGPNDPPERWNWDSPVLISPHDNKRIYFGSQRLWRSDDRGDSWEVISDDLTTNTNRYELELMDRVWSVDALYDNGAMSKYATLTSMSESPVAEGVIYTGSDDGLIHVTEDGGQNWRESGKLSGVPGRSFINDIEVSQHDDQVVFAIADAHKFGDYTPYIFMSSNRGKTWQSIRGDMPDGNIVWVIKQDHVDKNLLFLGTEFGLYYTYNQGQNWIKLASGVPTIPFRDIEIQARDNDLVGATFGRGFYVLDDYSVLRSLADATQAKRHTLFSVRDAWWYVPYVPMQAKGMPTLGSTRFVSENPSFGALLTYYLDELPNTAKETRTENERKAKEQSTSVSFPGWEVLREETLEEAPQVMLLIRTESGDPVRWIPGTKTKGINRVHWDLRWPAPNPISLTKPAFSPPWVGDPQGPLARPGTYSAQLFVEFNGQMTAQGDPQTFQVKPIPAMSANLDFEAMEAFQQKTRKLLLDLTSTSSQLSEANDQMRFLKAALPKTPKANEQHFARLAELKKDLAAIRLKLNGDPIRRQLDESSSPSIISRAWNAASGHWSTTQMPTATQRQNVEMAEIDFNALQEDVDSFLNALDAFEDEMKQLGAPYTRGRG